MAEADAHSGAQEGGQLTLQRIYLKDVSFESPRAPEIFREGWKPQVSMDLNSQAQRVEGEVYEVVLTLTVTVRDDQERTAYIVEVQQAGLFGVAGVEGETLRHALSSYCPSVLFPYARETVDTLAVRGTFPALMLGPVNFDALYAEARRRHAEAGAQQH